MVSLTKDYKIGAIAAIITFLLLRISFFNVHNDWVLWQVQHRFSQIPHPQDSTLIYSQAQLGRWGNSNHCDYFVGEIRETTFSEQEILDFYKPIKLPPAKGLIQPLSGFPYVNIRVAFLKNNQIYDPDIIAEQCSLPTNLCQITAWDVDTSLYPNRTLYVAYVFDAGYEPNDIRCY